MSRREFLMLAHPMKPKHLIAGFYMSEKLDGGRCFWDGGISRGVPTLQVPWANTLNPKTGQLKTNIKPISSGLWSRYGNPIMAPDWFLNTLPCCPIDGELWAGRGKFQQTMSTIKKKVPVDSEWESIKYGIFGTPNFFSVMRDGEIKNPNFHKTIVLEEVKKWLATRGHLLSSFLQMIPDAPFSAELANLNSWLDMAAETHFLIPQTKLPMDEEEARAIVEAVKKKIIEGKGEGIFLHAPSQVWEPKRVHACLKVKGQLDGEGVITGFVSGRKTERGSKLLGLIGALVLDYKGNRLELSGLTNEERRFSGDHEEDWAYNSPGEEMPPDTQGLHFKVGDTITFFYRELTDSGIPKEARYFRKRA